MADKAEDDSSQGCSPSVSDSEEISDNEENETTIPSIPPIEPQENGEDNSAAIERFLEQVAGPLTTEDHNADPAATEVRGVKATEVSKVKATDRETQHAKRMMVPPECRCQLNGGRPCHTRFSKGELMLLRHHYLSLGKKELDIAVLAKLECGIHLTTMTTRKKRKPTMRKKHRTDFYHRGYRICNVMFVYLHGFSYKKLKALILQYKTNGVRTRVHKNLKPKLTQVDIKPKKKKPKAKVKPRSKESKSKECKDRQCRDRQGKDRKWKGTEPKGKIVPTKKGKKDESGESVQGGSSVSSCHTITSAPKLPPPAPLPPQPPSNPPYPTTFALTSQPHHHHPHPTPYMPPTPTPQPAFPHAVSYNVNGAPLFHPHPMSIHTPHPHPHPATSTPHPPSVDYCSQGALPNPAVDFSHQRNSAHNMATFQSNAPRPCVTYSVVHSVTF